MSTIARLPQYITVFSLFSPPPPSPLSNKPNSLLSPPPPPPPPPLIEKCAVLDETDIN